MNAVKNSTLGKVVMGVVAFAFAVSAYAPTASAQTSEELQAQIASLLAQIAALQGQLGTQGGSTSGLYCSFSFLRDLSSGSTGSDVMDLQKFLNSAGFTVSASGAGSAGMETSYFGPATAAAVSAFQVHYSADILAPLGLTSGTGYWGASSRAKARMLCDTQAPTTPGDSDDDDADSGDLSGGEASLEDYDSINSLSNEDVSAGDEEVEVYGVEFDVEDGDIAIRRVDVNFQAGETSATADEDPWDYFETVHLLINGEEVDSVDVDDEDAWDEQAANSDIDASAVDHAYQVRFTGLNEVIEEGETAEVTFAITMRGVIDSADEDQVWNIWVPTNGIRAIDGAGINQYVPDSETEAEANAESFSIEAQEDGDLTIREHDDNPEAAILVVEADDESDEYTVLVSEFEADKGGVLIDSITVRATTTGATNAADLINTVTLVVDGTEYSSDTEDDDQATGVYTFEDLDIEIDEDEELEVAVLADFVDADADNDDTDGAYDDTGAETVQFGILAADVDAEGLQSGDASTVTGDATGNTHTLLLAGIVVEGNSTSANVTISDTVANSTGTYTIKFDVTAIGEDLYIKKTSGTASTSGVEFEIVGDSYTGTTSSSLTSTADEETNSFLVEEGDTETFTLRVVIDPATSGFYGLELEGVPFFTSDSSTDSDYTDATIPDTSEFETDHEFVQS